MSYITGESIAAVSSSTFLESLRKKGLEVMYMVAIKKEFKYYNMEVGEEGQVVMGFVNFCLFCLAAVVTGPRERFGRVSS